MLNAHKCVPLGKEFTLNVVGLLNNVSVDICLHHIHTALQLCYRNCTAAVIPTLCELQVWNEGFLENGFSECGPVWDFSQQQLHYYCKFVSCLFKPNGRVLWSLSDCLRGVGGRRSLPVPHLNSNILHSAYSLPLPVEGACVLQSSPAVLL